MGAMGSDAAIEAADVVLMDDDPMQIAKAIKISASASASSKQNIVFSLIKFGCLALTAFGLANMWAAIFAGCRCYDYRGSQRHPRFEVQRKR